MRVKWVLGRGGFGPVTLSPETSKCPLSFVFPFPALSPLFFFCWAQLDESLGDFRQTLITLDLVLVRRIGGNLVKSRPKRRSQDLRRLKKRSHIKFLGSGRGRWFQFQWFNCLTPHALLHTNCPRFFPTPFILAEYRRNTHTIGSGCTTRTRSPVYSVRSTVHYTWTIPSYGAYPLCFQNFLSMESEGESKNQDRPASHPRSPSAPLAPVSGDS